MEWLLWSGVGITVLGLAGLVWCIVAAARARGAGLDEPALKARLQKLVTVNLASLGIASLGLMTVIMALFLR